jgi:hypothetical protein
VRVHHTVCLPSNYSGCRCSLRAWCAFQMPIWGCELVQSTRLPTNSSSAGYDNCNSNTPALASRSGTKSHFLGRQSSTTAPCKATCDVGITNGRPTAATMDVLSWILRHASRKAWTAMNSGVECHSRGHSRHVPTRSKPIPGRSSCSISGVLRSFLSPQYRVAHTIILQTQKQLHSLKHSVH